MKERVVRFTCGHQISVDPEDLEPDDPRWAAMEGGRCIDCMRANIARMQEVGGRLQDERAMKRFLEAQLAKYRQGEDN
jgi:hypothetical protein